ncbi:MAG: PH domain-containing protein [Tyzzerella sp.]|nr:PH domain-containing protein [Tyzzerella sp.]
MELKKLDKSVLKLWYIRAVIGAMALIGVFVSVIAVLTATGAPSNVMLAVLLGVGVVVALLLCFTLIMPMLRYKMYAWGYDDKRIIVKQGVIFKRRVVIPVCQIQDLHRTQGPLMMMLKLSGVTISTAGSNFDISTLTTEEADRMLDELEHNLEARIEELRNEEI